MIRTVDEAPAGAQWALGTEHRLVARLQQQHPEQLIVSLAEVPPFCGTMSKLTLDNLVDVLEGLVQGRPVNEVTVEPETVRMAKVALDRMLSL
jgi:quinolinate synthase